MEGDGPKVNVKELAASELQTLVTLDSDFKYYQRAEQDQTWSEKLRQIGKKVNSLQLSGGKLGTLISDFDNRVPLYVLSGLALNAQRMEDSDLRTILTTAATHPTRGIREAARIYLFTTGVLSPTPAAARAWEITAKRDLTGSHLHSWTEYRLRNIIISSLSTDEWYGHEDMFPGRDNRWAVQNAYPIMALLFRSGVTEWRDLLCVDLNSAALTEDVNHLISIKEVLRKEVSQCIFKPPKIQFELVRGESWSGPPF